jgi:hypothetical protein
LDDGIEAAGDEAAFEFECRDHVCSEEHERDDKQE